MLDFHSAQAQILAVAREKKLTWERVSLSEAATRVLGSDIVSPTALPAFDHSAMDGYAVRLADLSNAETQKLRVAGESRAGHALPNLEPNTAARIFTGAHLPLGADAVIMQENVHRSGEFIEFDQKLRLYENVRRRGSDLEIGTVALKKGTRISPFQLGLLAMLDQVELNVVRRPRVRILCTGDELRAVGDLRFPEKLPESNSIALAALARAAGSVVEIFPRVLDELETMQDALREAATGADLLLTVGGVSVGDHDLVRPALDAIGAETSFWKVAMKPGKPLLFGQLGTTLVLGLPGNPASAQVTMSLFGVPLLRALAGETEALRPPRTARLAEGFTQKAGRMNFLRAHFDGETVRILDNQSSGAGTAIAWANAFAIIPADATVVPAEHPIQVIAYQDL
jgi:molybdopterin molybdotransferase